MGRKYKKNKHHSNRSKKLNNKSDTIMHNNTPIHTEDINTSYEPLKSLDINESVDNLRHKIPMYLHYTDDTCQIIDTTKSYIVLPSGYDLTNLRVVHNYDPFNSFILDSLTKS